MPAQVPDARQQAVATGPMVLGLGVAVAWTPGPPEAGIEAASQCSLHAHIAAFQMGTHTMPNVLGRRKGNPLT